MTIKVAAFQGTPMATWEERTFQIRKILERADQQRCDFLCFPEGFLTGYFAEKNLTEWAALVLRLFNII
jgi:predicted amidohydrolase